MNFASRSRIRKPEASSGIPEIHDQVAACWINRPIPDEEPEPRGMGDPTQLPIVLCLVHREARVVDLTRHLGHQEADRHEHHDPPHPPRARAAIPRSA